RLADPEHRRDDLRSRGERREAERLPERDREASPSPPVLLEQNPQDAGTRRERDRKDVTREHLEREEKGEEKRACRGRTPRAREGKEDPRKQGEPRQDVRVEALRDRDAGEGVGDRPDPGRLPRCAKGRQEPE